MFVRELKLTDEPHHLLNVQRISSAHTLSIVTAWIFQSQCQGRLMVGRCPWRRRGVRQTTDRGQVLQTVSNVSAGSSVSGQRTLSMIEVGQYRHWRASGSGRESSEKQVRAARVDRRPPRCDVPLGKGVFPWLVLTKRRTSPPERTRVGGGLRRSAGRGDTADARGCAGVDRRTGRGLQHASPGPSGRRRQILPDRGLGAGGCKAAGVACILAPPSPRRSPGGRARWPGPGGTVPLMVLRDAGEARLGKPCRIEKATEPEMARVAAISARPRSACRGMQWPGDRARDQRKPPLPTSMWRSTARLRCARDHHALWRHGRVWTMSTPPEHQGKGMGRALLSPSSQGFERWREALLPLRYRSRPPALPPPRLCHARDEAAG